MKREWFMVLWMLVVPILSGVIGFDTGRHFGKREQYEASHHQFYIDHGAAKALPPCFTDNPDGITVFTKPQPDGTKPTSKTGWSNKPLKPGDRVDVKPAEPHLISDYAECDLYDCWAVNPDGTRKDEKIFGDYVDAETGNGSVKQKVYVECTRLKDRTVSCKAWAAGAQSAPADSMKTKAWNTPPDEWSSVDSKITETVDPPAPDLKFSHQGWLLVKCDAAGKPIPNEFCGQPVVVKQP